MPRGRAAAVRGTAGRISWGLADQGVSSLTNFAVGAFVARTLGATAFGIFSLVWVTYGVLVNVSRGLASDPLVVRFSGDPDSAQRAAVGRMTGTATAIGLVVGITCVLVGAVVGGALGAAFVALGVVATPLLLQDAWRFSFFAAGQGRKAFANDLVWGVILIPSMLFAVAHDAGVYGYVLAWGLPAALAAAFGCVQARLLPRPASARHWLREHRDLGPRYLAENVATGGGSQLRMYGVGAVAGLAAVGTIRGGELLVGPFLAVLMGLSLVAVPEAARVLRRSPRRLPLFCAVLGAGQAAAALLWGLTLLFLVPEAAGRFVLGSLWEPSFALIVPITVSVMNASLATGAAAGLRALGAARRSLRAQLVNSAGYVIGGIAGAAVAGAYGSAWGVAGATLIGAGTTWLQLRRGLAEAAHRPPADATVGATGPPSEHDQNRGAT